MPLGVITGASAPVSSLGLLVTDGNDAAGASAGGAGVNSNAAAAATAGPSLASASGTSIPGKMPGLLVVIRFLL